jgi:hypothetical protein
MCLNPQCLFVLNFKSLCVCSWAELTDAEVSLVCRLISSKMGNWHRLNSKYGVRSSNFIYLDFMGWIKT